MSAIPAPGRSIDLDRLLQGSQLPALPQSAIRLLELSKDAKNGPADYAGPIEADPGLAAQVLKFVNSSYFGLAREVLSVKHAISLVGVRTIKNFVLWTAVFSLMPNPKSGPIDLKALRQDSLRRGLFARGMARRLGVKDAEDLFSAALLQDMAIPILAKALPNEYAELAQQRRERGVPLSELERERFGWDHAEAAGRLVTAWNMPASFATLISLHTKLDEVGARPTITPEEAAVLLSSLLPSVLEAQWRPQDRFDDLFRRAVESRDVSVLDVLQETDREMADFSAILHLDAPAEPLSVRYQAALEPAAQA
jgi:HD-like signal output (HDOD) protein